MTVMIKATMPPVSTEKSITTSADLKRALLSALSADEYAGNSDRNARIADFAVAFASDAQDTLDPVVSIIRCIGDRWSTFILTILECGMFRHTELHRVINFFCDLAGAPVISQRVLTQKLRAFERDGIVSRTVRPTVPLRTEYRLTPMGTELIKLIDEVRYWSLAQRGIILEAQRNYDEKMEFS